MPLVISGATSGQTTLAATDAVTATITLPSAAGTLIATAPGTSGNVLTSNGTAWTSATPSTVTFASSAENAAGTIENKAVDPLGIREAFNASGSAPVYACRAWVNFNGAGTVAIRASGNVSSITDNGTGDYTVNFTTAMPDANYGFSSGSKQDSTYNDRHVSCMPVNSSSVRVISAAYSIGLHDSEFIGISIFR